MPIPYTSVVITKSAADMLWAHSKTGLQHLEIADGFVLIQLDREVLIELVKVDAPTLSDAIIEVCHNPYELGD